MPKRGGRSIPKPARADDPVLIVDRQGVQLAGLGQRPNHDPVAAEGGVQGAVRQIAGKDPVSRLTRWDVPAGDHPPLAVHGVAAIPVPLGVGSVSTSPSPPQEGSRLPSYR